MKITVDTKEDSPEDIKKVIKMLQHLVGEQSYANAPNIFDDPSPSATPTETTNAFANMFGDAPADKEPKLKLMEEEKEEIPRVIPY